jgi:hypothetical protein
VIYAMYKYNSDDEGDEYQFSQPSDAAITRYMEDGNVPLDMLPDEQSIECSSPPRGILWAVCVWILSSDAVSVLNARVPTMYQTKPVRLLHPLVDEKQYYYVSISRTKRSLQYAASGIKERINADGNRIFSPAQPDTWPHSAFRQKMIFAPPLDYEIWREEKYKEEGRIYWSRSEEVLLTELLWNELNIRFPRCLSRTFY